MERDVLQVRKQNHTRREFKMVAELQSYEMDGIMLNIGYVVNNLLKKYLYLMGKLNLVWLDNLVV
jgi:hypothetical protein